MERDALIPPDALRFQLKHAQGKARQEKEDEQRKPLPYGPCIHGRRYLLNQQHIPEEQAVSARSAAVVEQQPHAARWII